MVVFVAGLSIGLVIEKARLISSEQNNLEQKLELSSLQVQQLFLDTHSINDCDSIQNVIESNMDGLDQSMKRLIKYKKSAMINGGDFDLNLRNYFITELQYLLISEKIEKLCDTTTVNILYFYSRLEESDVQGYVLDFIKKKFGSQVRIFSFNAEFKQEPMIGLLIETYDLKQFPALIIDTKTFEGYTSEEEIAKEICDNINNMSPYCL
ncbi:MAG: hypothetical protein V1914_02780 [archaeon]